MTNDRVLSLVQEIMAMEPMDRQKVIHTVQLLDGEPLKSSQSLPVPWRQPEVTGAVEITSERALRSVQSWYASACESKDPRTQYRLLAESLEGAGLEVEIEFLEDKMRRIRAENKLLAIEIAMTSFAYQRPFSTLFGTLGLMLAIWNFFSAFGRGIFKVLF